MKRKLIILFIFIMIITFNVKADETSNWNKFYEHNDFKYTINNLNIKVYKWNEEQVVDFNNLVYTVPLTTDKYTINPTYIDSDIKQENSKVIGKGTFVDLNLNIEESEIKQILYDKFGNPKDTGYTFTVEVTYTMEKIPSTYTFMYHASIYDNLLHLGDSSFVFPKAELNKPQTQILGTGNYYQTIYFGDGVTMEDTDDIYEFDYSNGGLDDLYSRDYLWLRQNELTVNDKVNLSYELDTNSYVFKLHNNDEIEKVINNFSTWSNLDEDELQKELNNNGAQIKEVKKSNQVVDVKDTVSNISLVMMVIGITTLLVGLALIIKCFESNKLNNNI